MRLKICLWGANNQTIVCYLCLNLVPDFRIMVPTLIKATGKLLPKPLILAIGMGGWKIILCCFLSWRISRKRKRFERLPTENDDKSEGK